MGEGEQKKKKPTRKNNTIKNPPYIDYLGKKEHFFH